MAEIKLGSGLIAERARVIDDPRDSTKPVDGEKKPADQLEGLRAWVMGRVKQWRDHRHQNYELQWDSYERLWRGLWAMEDQNKKSEKSRLVTPALGEAVENIVAEVEEAVMGRGDLFDMRGEVSDSPEMKEITDKNKAHLKEDLSRPELPVVFTTAMGEALINSAVFGSGIGEIFVKKFKLKEVVSALRSMQPMQPPMQPQQPMQPMQPGMEQGMHQMPDGSMMPDSQMMPTGGAPAPMAGPTAAPAPNMPPMMKIEIKEITFSYLQSVNPRNFLIDPIARSIDTALGVAIEEYVGAHIIRAGQKEGEYRKVEISTSAGDTDITTDPQVENEYVYDKVAVVRYYGLVPEHLLFPEGETVDLTVQSEGEALGAAVNAAEEEIADLLAKEDEQNEGTSGKKSEEPVDGDMIEAVVVIANDSVVLKAVQTPYLMEDRPVVAFPWDIVPGRFWGRGVCEKGEVPQRVMDAEMRARIDALAFISAPMMAMDASKLPRGFQFKVKPGRSILTNGDPKNIINPLHFGQLDQSTFQHSQQLDQMVQRATGSLDVISLAQRAGGDARPGAVSMMLSGIVKRHKRTLMNFVDRFYVPALRKIMWRNMQFCPERYTPMNWSFTASTTMGILQREYESQILSSLMQTMDPASKEYKILLMGVVGNTGLTHRTSVMKMIEESITNAAAMENMQTQSAVDPIQAQLAQVGARLQIAEMEAKIRELNSRAQLQDVKARNAMIEPEFRRAEVLTKGIYSVQADQQERAIQQRNDYLDRVLAWEDIKSNERIAKIQSGASVRSEAMKAGASVRSESMKSRAAVASEAVKARADARRARNEARLAAHQTNAEERMAARQALVEDRTSSRQSRADVAAARAQAFGRSAQVLR